MTFSDILSQCEQNEVKNVVQSQGLVKLLTAALHFNNQIKSLFGLIQNQNKKRQLFGVP